MTATQTGAAGTPDTPVIFATLVRGDTFGLLKSEKFFEKGVPKAVTKEEMEYLSEHGVEVRTLPAYDQDRDDGKVVTRTIPKFTFTCRTAAPAGEVS